MTALGETGLLPEDFWSQSDRDAIAKGICDFYEKKYLSKLFDGPFVCVVDEYKYLYTINI